MALNKKIPEWKSVGVEPPEELKAKGFTAGYKPPAAYFNWFFNRIGLSVKEIQDALKLLAFKDKVGDADIIDVAANKVTQDSTHRMHTDIERTNWNDANSKKHTHSNKTTIDKLTQAMLDKLTDIASGAEVNVQPDWRVTDAGSDAYIKNKPVSLPANGGTASRLSNAIQISDYNTFVPTQVAAGSVTPIMAGASAHSPWFNTTAGLLIQGSQECWHVLIFRSGSGGWAYRSYYQEKWSDWKIWSTFNGAYSSLTGKPNSFPPSSHTHSANQIIQDADHRFSTDAEKATWNQIESVKESLEKYASITVLGEILNLPGGGDIAVTGEILSIPLKI